jgi:MFS family permease
LEQDPKFNIALTIFYVPYLLVDVPSDWLIKRVGAGHYLPTLVVGWRIVSMCIGFVKTYQSLLVVRFFLGLMEGGLLGGIIILENRKRDRGERDERLSGD